MSFGALDPCLCCCSASLALSPHAFWCGQPAWYVRWPSTRAAVYLEPERKRWRRESTLLCCVGPNLFPNNAVYYLTYVLSRDFPTADASHAEMNAALRPEHQESMPACLALLPARVPP